MPIIGWLLGFLPGAIGSMLGTVLGQLIGLLTAVAGPVLAVGSALLVPVATALGQGIVWVWQSVLWPGLRDILDDWVTIVTVLAAGAALWLALVTVYEVRLRRAEAGEAVCRAELTRRRVPAPAPSEPRLELPWPFSGW